MRVKSVVWLSFFGVFMDRFFLCGAPPSQAAIVVLFVSAPGQFGNVVAA
jgi:hypothetical protein